MKFPFVPDYYFPDIYAIDPERLRARGVKVLLADLDNTLAPYGVPRPSGEVVAWRARLEQAGITLFLLSNSRRPGRAQHYAEALGMGRRFARRFARIQLEPCVWLEDRTYHGGTAMDFYRRYRKLLKKMRGVSGVRL